MSVIEVVSDRQQVVDHLSLDPSIHVYGLADLELPFWNVSRWWRRAGAFVGRVPLAGPDGVVAVYAIAPRATDETSLLVRDLCRELPIGALVVGPTGCDDRVGESSEIERLGPHVKMTVTATSFIEPDGPNRAQRLSTDDLPALLELYDTDPGAAFFLPPMLDDGLFYGVWEEGELLAAGGTHVRSDEFGVAALGGIITAPRARGRGLAADVTAKITKELLAEGRLVALNTHVDNDAARKLYKRLGYTEIHTYTEFILGDPL